MIVNGLTRLYAEIDLFRGADRLVSSESLAMRKLIALLVVGVLLSFGQIVSAGPLEDGVAAMKRGDYATALRLWRLLAEQGDGAGAPFALFMIGAMYRNGHGVAQDNEEAVKWYRLAADQGYAAAQSNLGVMYSNGEGVAQNFEEAVKWYRLSAQQGHVMGQINLATKYLAGEGVAQDYVRAHMWFNIVASTDSSADSRYKTVRDAVATKMTPAQIAQAQEMAQKCQQSKFKDCGW